MDLGTTAILLALHALAFVSRCGGSAVISPDRLSNVTKTLAYLLDNYDIRLRPNFAGDPLHVGMELTIGSFDSISEVNMDYTITLYLNQYWKDERLSFSTADEVFNLSGDFAEKIWVPDTFFANDKSSFLHDVTEKNKMVRLYGDGSIVYGMRFTTTLACMMDLHYYPLDSQNCTVEIESYGYTVGDVVMYWREVPVVGVEKIDLPQFTILDHDTSDRIEGLATGRYQRLSLSFRMQRNIGYFVFQTYLPSILIVMLSWVSFWINHEATSARVALGITTVLTMTTISTGVRSSLPRISYVKAIDIYLVMCFIFVFAALLEFAAVNYTYWGARAKRKAKKYKEGGGGGGLDRGTRPRQKSDEIIELQELRMSPIPSLRQRHNNRAGGGVGGAGGGGPTETESGTKFPPSFRMVGVQHAYGYPHHPRGIFYTARHHHHHHHHQHALHVHGVGSGPGSGGRRRVLQNLRRRAHSFRIALPKIKDVNVIDKFSRVIFPVSFILFNLGYWGFYIL